MESKFDLAFVNESFNRINTTMKQKKQIPITDFCAILDQFCILFAQMSSVLGMAFADVKEKASIIRNNKELFPEHQCLFSFVEMEMSKNIHILNGGNNSKKKAESEFKKYNSTARNLLRMMWFLSFLRSTFQQIRDKPPTTKLSEILDKAYDVAFADKHSWLIRKGAKLAISTGADKKRLVECIIGTYDEEKLQVENKKFLEEMVPVHQALWTFYEKNKLTDLE